jgi:4-amino-4-deoxy-L-arabinose transferase-like glycosyltransferase
VLRRLHLIPGVAVFLAIAAPWFLLVQARNPEFFDFFVVQEHFARFALSGHHRPGPWWYFLPIIVVGTMPWTPLVAAAVAQRGTTRTGSESRIDVDRFLLVWAATVLAFFSLSSSKLPPYVLPMLPALALLTARRLPLLEDRRTVRRAAGAAAAGAGVFAAAAVPVLATEKFAALAPLLADVPAWFVAADAALVAGAGAAWWLARAGRARAALLALAASSLAFGQLALGGAHAVDEFYSAERVVEKWLGDPPHLDDDAAFYSVGKFDPGLPFYLGRTVTLVAYEGELAPGIAAEPFKYVPSVETFERQWRAAERAYAEMDPALYGKLSEGGLPMHVLVRDVRRVIVARH